MKKQTVAKETENKIYKIMFYIIFLSMFFVGLIVGMVLQQMILKKGLIELLSSNNVNVEINFNETKLVDEMKQEIIPKIREIVENEK